MFDARLRALDDGTLLVRRRSCKINAATRCVTIRLCTARPAPLVRHHLRAAVCGRVLQFLQVREAAVPTCGTLSVQVVLQNRRDCYLYNGHARDD